MFLVLFTGRDAGSVVVHVGNDRKNAARIAEMLNRTDGTQASYGVEEVPTPEVGEFLTSERLSELLNRGAGRNVATGKVTATEGGPLGGWLREVEKMAPLRSRNASPDSLDSFLEFEPLAVSILVALKEGWKTVREAERDGANIRLQFRGDCVKVLTGGH